MLNRTQSFRKASWLSIGTCIALLASCSNRPDPNLPFDSEGNYVAAWDTDGSYKWEEPEAPDFYTPESDQALASAKPKSTSRPKSSKKRRKATPKSVRHTVKKGETLWRISRKYGTSVRKIQKANGISGSLIRPGQQLKIPR